MAFFPINSRVGRPPWSGAYLAVWFIAIGEAYVGEVCCFNDDIQGSGAAVLAGMLSAMSISGARLRDQTFLILGAGSAAIGIAQMLAEAMGLQGLSRTKARERVWLFNRNGLIESTRLDLTDYQKAYAHVHEGDFGLRRGCRVDKTDGDHRGEYGCQDVQSTCHRSYGSHQSASHCVCAFESNFLLGVQRGRSLRMVRGPCGLRERKPLSCYALSWATLRAGTM